MDELVFEFDNRLSPPARDTQGILGRLGINQSGIRSTGTYVYIGFVRSSQY
jgi:hypothetical protein